MTRGSVQPKHQIFVKGYGLLSFAKNMGKNIGENISKSWSCKYGAVTLACIAKVSDRTRQKLLGHAKQSAADVFKTASKKAIQKTAEATGTLIGNKIGNKITGVPKHPQQNNSETATIEYDKEIPKERYRSPEERQ